MRETRVSLPELGLIGGTRAMLGAGLGLLLANRLSPDQRRAVGWTLFIVGAVSTIPLALEVLGGGRLSAREGEPEQGPGRRRQALPAPPRGTGRADTGEPGGGRGRVDLTGVMPEGVRVDPNITEGHPGYQESGGSEITPPRR